MYDLNDFRNLRGARDRVRRGIVPSEQAEKRMEGPNPHPQPTAWLGAHVDTNPIRSAEQRYLREHGSEEYGQLLTRLLGELFPLQ